MMLQGKKPPLFQRIKAIIFDFDGTLAVLNIDFSLMRNEVFRLIHQLGVRDDSIREQYLLEIIDEVHSILREKDPSRANVFYERAHQILHEVEMVAAGQGRLIEGGEKVLKALRQKGVKVGIITRNCEEAVRKVFPDIDDYCDVFISRDSVRKVKPHPDHLYAAMNALGVLEKEAIMVGDHTIDIQAGKRVGMMTIGVLTGRIGKDKFKEAGADYILDDITGICEFLKG